MIHDTPTVTRRIRRSGSAPIPALLIFAALSAAGPGSALAQTGTATVTGTVADEAGNPVSGMSVIATAYVLDGAEIRSASGERSRTPTGADGTYELEIPVSEAGAFVVVEFVGDRDAGPAPGQADPAKLVVEAGERYTVDQTVAGVGEEETDGETSSEATSPGDVILLAYFPFDRYLNESARNLPTFQVVDEARWARSADNVIGCSCPEGRYGEALEYRPGERAKHLATNLDIDFNTHPQLTVSVWVRLDERKLDDEVPDESWFFSGGAGAATPQLGFSHEQIRARAGGTRPVHYAGGSLPVGEWVHVAAVWDYDARTLRVDVDGVSEVWEDLPMDRSVLTTNDRTQPIFEPNEGNEERYREHFVGRYVFIGAEGQARHYPLEWVALDDLRIYSGALTPEEIAAIRESEDRPADLGYVAAEYEYPPPSTEPANERSEEVEVLVGWGLSEDREESGLSGSVGDEPRVAVDLETYGFERLRTYEKNNVPCEVLIRTHRYNVEDESWIDEGSWSDNCENPGPSAVSAELPPDYFVTSLQVCQNRRSERVKGIRLAGRRVELDEEAGEVVLGESVRDEETLPNCNQRRGWMDAVTCGGGQMASGVWVYPKDYGPREGRTVGNRDGVVGLRLICRDLVGVYE